MFGLETPHILCAVLGFFLARWFPSLFGGGSGGGNGGGGTQPASPDLSALLRALLDQLTRQPVQPAAYQQTVSGNVARTRFPVEVEVATQTMPSQPTQPVA